MGLRDHSSKAPTLTTSNVNVLCQICGCKFIGRRSEGWYDLRRCQVLPAIGCQHNWQCSRYRCLNILISHNSTVWMSLRPTRSNQLFPSNRGIHLDPSFSVMPMNNSSWIFQLVSWIWTCGIGVWLIGNNLVQSSRASPFYRPTNTEQRTSSQNSQTPHKSAVPWFRGCGGRWRARCRPNFGDIGRRSEGGETHSFEICKISSC